VLKAASQEVKMTLVDLALGEKIPDKGKVLIQGQPVAKSAPGIIGWIPEAGGMISNLKVWENITLPGWYHRKRQKASTEEKITRLLNELKVDKQDWERFMASPGARLSQYERKLAGLLRGLLLAPTLLLIDEDLFDDIETTQKQIWIDMLEKFVREVDGRALLVVATSGTLLPWKMIE